MTGLIWTPSLRAAAARGALDRREMFTAIEPGGVRLADGSFLAAAVILWATGFRAELEHLSPLHLRGSGGGIAMDGTQVAAEERVHLVGYGPSSSTIGANRAGRAAVAGIVRMLGAEARTGAAGVRTVRFAVGLLGSFSPGGSSRQRNDGSIDREEGSLDVADNSLASVLAGLRRFPDVEAPNLQAWDATDKLLLETASELLTPESRIAVIGDRYGALTLGALASYGVRDVKVHQDLITGERALRNNAAGLGIDAGFEQLPLGAALFD